MLVAVIETEHFSEPLKQLPEPDVPGLLATKYLENYLGWHRWLDRWGEHDSPIAGLQAAFGREKINFNC